MCFANLMLLTVLSPLLLHTRSVLYRIVGKIGEKKQANRIIFALHAHIGVKKLILRSDDSFDERSSHSMYLYALWRCKNYDNLIGF